MPTVFMMVGIAGAGKTSTVQSIASHDDVIISTDNYLEAYAKKNDLTYNEAFEMVHREAEMQLRQEVAFAIKHQLDIIWDQTNTTKKARARKLAMIPKNYKRIAVFVDTSVEDLHKTNQIRAERGRSLPNSVLDNMIKNFQPPTEDEGFEKVITVKGRP